MLIVAILRLDLDVLALRSSIGLGIWSDKLQVTLLSMCNRLTQLLTFELAAMTW